LYEKKWRDAKAEVPKIEMGFSLYVFVLFHKKEKIHVSQDNKKILKGLRKTAGITGILSQQNRRKMRGF
jgi:hypothetical protein